MRICFDCAEINDLDVSILRFETFKEIKVIVNLYVN